ncbi:hypothetical protein Amet_0281 [Alkaliphilus metalliredigens QYMF]|uniref:Uncharacterized protein n=1 Tax=Alkaliphilus metalliredigens (strain QYMF) TaxID=293826 RepID=A6TJZ5_ALKMQ|nr:hypothetical protein [Alkaliphilus metalliredigens]ABR46513.1 hypothetical protein Amet_0281 [Alkaliphilus metalliredigens QYMF]
MRKPMYIIVLQFVLILMILILTLTSLNIVEVENIYGMQPLNRDSIHNVVVAYEGGLDVSNVISRIGERRESLRERIERSRDTYENLKSNNSREIIIKKRSKVMERVDAEGDRVCVEDTEYNHMEGKNKKYLAYNPRYLIIKNQIIRGHAIGLRSPPVYV